MFWTFVDRSQLVGGQVIFEGPQAHHLARVLRVRPGERGIAVSTGREYEVEVVTAEGDRVVARVLDNRPAHGEPRIHIALLQAILPNPDFDAVIEGGTAVGISRFIAVQAERSIARPDASRRQRWQLIAESAAEQSHRGAIPVVTGPTTLAEALDREVQQSRLVVLDPGAARSLASAANGAEAYSLAVGPEGGWSDTELAMMRDRGAVAVNLGPRILRARLAPIVAAAILVQQS